MKKDAVSQLIYLLFGNDFNEDSLHKLIVELLGEYKDYGGNIVVNLTNYFKLLRESIDQINKIKCNFESSANNKKANKKETDENKEAYANKITQLSHKLVEVKNASSGIDKAFPQGDDKANLGNYIDNAIRALEENCSVSKIITLRTINEFSDYFNSLSLQYILTISNMLQQLVNQKQGKNSTGMLGNRGITKELASAIHKEIVKDVKHSEIDSGINEYIKFINMLPEHSSLYVQYCTIIARIYIYQEWRKMVDDSENLFKPFSRSEYVTKFINLLPDDVITNLQKEDRACERVYRLTDKDFSGWEKTEKRPARKKRAATAPVEDDLPIFALHDLSASTPDLTMAGGPIGGPEGMCRYLAWLEFLMINSISILDNYATDTLKGENFHEKTNDILTYLRYSRETWEYIRDSWQPHKNYQHILTNKYLTGEESIRKPLVSFLDQFASNAFEQIIRLFSEKELGKHRRIIDEFRNSDNHTLQNYKKITYILNQLKSSLKIKKKKGSRNKKNTQADERQQRFEQLKELIDACYSIAPDFQLGAEFRNLGRIKSLSKDVALKFKKLNTALLALKQKKIDLKYKDNNFYLYSGFPSNILHDYEMQDFSDEFKRFVIPALIGALHKRKTNVLGNDKIIYYTTEESRKNGVLLSKDAAFLNTDGKDSEKFSGNAKDIEKLYDDIIEYLNKNICEINQLPSFKEIIGFVNIVLNCEHDCIFKINIEEKYDVKEILDSALKPKKAVARQGTQCSFFNVANRNNIKVFTKIGNNFSVNIKEILNQTKANIDMSSPNTNWYTDDVMDALFNDLAKNSDITTTLKAATASLDLKDALNTYHDERNNSIKSNQAVSNNLIIPININNNHWVSVYIKYQENSNTASKIYYFDPFGNDPESSVSDVLQNIKRTNTVTVKHNNRQIQSDNISCGPIAVEAMKRLLDGSNLDGDFDVNNIRRLQLESLPKETVNTMLPEGEQLSKNKFDAFKKTVADERKLNPALTVTGVIPWALRLGDTGVLEEALNMELPIPRQIKLVETTFLDRAYDINELTDERTLYLIYNRCATIHDKERWRIYSSDGVSDSVNKAIFDDEKNVALDENKKFELLEKFKDLAEAIDNGGTEELRGNLDNECRSYDKYRFVIMNQEPKEGFADDTCVNFSINDIVIIIYPDEKYEKKWKCKMFYDNGSVSNPVPCDDDINTLFNELTGAKNVGSSISGEYLFRAAFTEKQKNQVWEWVKGTSEYSNYLRNDKERVQKLNQSHRDVYSTITNIGKLLNDILFTTVNDTVNLSSSNLGEDVTRKQLITIIKQLNFNATIKTLDLSCQEITEELAGAIKNMLLSNKTITTLKLNGCIINNKSLNTIITPLTRQESSGRKNAGSNQNTTLKTLEIAHCSKKQDNHQNTIGSEAVKSIILDLVSNPNALELLNITGLSLKNEELISIIEKSTDGLTIQSSAAYSDARISLEQKNADNKLPNLLIGTLQNNETSFIKIEKEQFNNLITKKVSTIKLNEKRLSVHQIKLFIAWLAENRNNSVTTIKLDGVNLSGLESCNNILDNLAKLTNLQTLSLANCSLPNSEDVYSRVSSLLNTNNMRQLDLSGNDVYAKGLELISCGLRNNGHLEGLNLSRCFANREISDKELITLAKHAPKTLNLIGNNLTEKQILLILKEVPKKSCRVEELDLSGNNESSDVRKRISELKKSINVRYDKMVNIMLSEEPSGGNQTRNLL